MSNPLIDQLQDILHSIVQEQISVTPDDNLFELGILDSVLLIQLVSRLEEHYGISVADREMSPDNFLSIGRIQLYLSQKLATAHAS